MNRNRILVVRATALWTCCLLGASLSAVSQSPAAFAACSIRPVVFAPGRRNRIPVGLRTDPAGLHWGAVNLRTLIEHAYGINDTQLSGGRAWMSSQYFRVDATTPSPATDAQLLAMLRTALKDRFHLRLRVAPGKVPGYALEIGPAGPKFHKLADHEQAPPAPPGREYFSLATTTSELVFWLNANHASPPLGRPVVDRTGLVGQYSLWFLVGYDNVDLSAEYPGSRNAHLTHRQDIRPGLESLGFILVPTVLEQYTIESASEPTAN